MDAKQAKNLISKGEGISIEFKASQEELTKSGFETAVSFLNTIGGYIFLGVDDDGNIIVVDEEKISNMKLDFANLINNKNKVNPPVPLALQEIYIDSKCILYVYIPESSEVHKLNNSIIYERTDDGDRDITENTYAVKRLYARKSGRASEEIVYPDITFDDFNKETITKAKKLIGINNVDGNWDNLSAEEILNQKCFYRQDPDTGKQGYTLASLLLFGKKESIIGKLSGYKVDVIKRIKDTERYDDRYICEENLIDSYDALQKYINFNIDNPFYLDENGVTYNAVGVVVRELVSNILIHREFMDGGTARILLYKDKIISENPNSPKLFTDMDLEYCEPFAKNKTIGRIFRMMGYADEIGSGFVKIKKACDNFFKSKPIFIDKDTFKAEVNLISDLEISNQSLSQKELIIRFIQKNGKITNEQCRDLLHIEKSRVGELLTLLTEEAIIYRHGKGKATYYDLNK